MTETAVAEVPMSELSAGERAVRAVYFALVLWIPIENLYVLVKGEGNAGGITFSRPLGILLFGLALIEWRRCFRRIPPAIWMVAWYIGVFSLSQLWVPREIQATFLRQRMVLLQNTAIFLISANLFLDAEFRRALLRSYGWWISLVAVGMLLGIFGEHFGEGRDALGGQDPNVTAVFYALGGVCIAGDPWIFASRRFIARLFAALLAIYALIMAILQTGSRGGLIVFGCGIMGLAICGGKATRKKRLLIACAVIGVVGAMILRDFQRGTVAASRLTATWDEGDTAGRTQIYDAAWAMFQERPLLGYGGANNLFTLGARLNFAEYGGTYSRATHNLLLSLLTEVGLVGAVPFVGAIFVALWKAWRHGRRTDDALPFALLCAVIIFNTSISGIDQRICWIVFAAAVACAMEPDAAGKRGTREVLSADQEACAT
jgi:O-antigen ligase